MVEVVSDEDDMKAILSWGVAAVLFVATLLALELFYTHFPLPAAILAAAIILLGVAGWVLSGRRNS